MLEVKKQGLAIVLLQSGYRHSRNADLKKDLYSFLKLPLRGKEKRDLSSYAHVIHTEFKRPVKSTYNWSAASQSLFQFAHLVRSSSEKDNSETVFWVTVLQCPKQASRQMGFEARVGGVNQNTEHRSLAAASRDSSWCSSEQMSNGAPLRQSP